MVSTVASVNSLTIGTLKVSDRAGLRLQGGTGRKVLLHVEPISLLLLCVVQNEENRHQLICPQLIMLSRNFKRYECSFSNIGKLIAGLELYANVTAFGVALVVECVHDDVIAIIFAGLVNGMTLVYEEFFDIIMALRCDYMLPSPPRSFRQCLRFRQPHPPTDRTNHSLTTHDTQTRPRSQDYANRG